MVYAPKTYGLEYVVTVDGTARTLSSRFFEDLSHKGDKVEELVVPGILSVVLSSAFQGENEPAELTSEVCARPIPACISGHSPSEERPMYAS
jgi:hypothetical protein